MNVERPDLLVDVQRLDGTSVGIFLMSDYVALPDDVVANTVAELFTRCDGCGRRNDLGTRAQLARALGATADDYSRSKVAAR